MLKIGCHLSISKGFYKAGKDIISIGGNTFQFFTRNPQGFKAKEFDQNDYDKYLELEKEHNLIRPLAHAPYTMNLSSDSESIRESGKEILRLDIERLEYFDHCLYNIHPGNHKGQGVEVGIDYIAKALNEVIKPEQKTIVLLELMSGKGNDIGRSFEEIKAIIDRVELKNKIGVCLDTCHVYSAGYDLVNDLDGVINEFDRIIGLNYLMAIHLNDSKMPFNSNKDRHEKIGEGVIGIDTFIKIINHPKLRHLPFYLETPNETLAGYGKEIEFLKKQYMKF